MKPSLSKPQDIINFVLLDVKMLSRAPSMPGGLSNAEQRAWARRERQVQYKAVDNNGNIWYVVNPAAWQMAYKPRLPVDIFEGRRYTEPEIDYENPRFLRPRPKFAMSYPDAMAIITGATVNPRKKPSAVDSSLKPKEGSRVAKGTPQLALLEASSASQAKGDPEVLPKESPSDEFEVNF